jgi:hypothetical protein
VNGFQQLAGVLQQSSYKSQPKAGANHTSQDLGELRFELGTVLAPPPDLSIQIDGLSVPIIKEFIVVAEDLCKHKRKVSIRNQGKTKIYSESVDDLYPKLPPQSSHDYKYIELSNSEFELIEGEIEFLDELKKGDRIIVASCGSLYFILDRAVRYT